METDAAFAGQAAPSDHAPTAVALRARGLVKAFGGVPVLKGVDLDVGAGRIHALLGSNGSGKSTFVRLVTGTYAAGRGSEIVLSGRRFTTDLSPAAAREAGARTVHQESPLIGQMTVAEHFGLDRGFPTGIAGRIRGAALEALAREALERVGAPIDPRRHTRDLQPAERAQVALALAMTDLGASGNGLLVLDEATALLPAPDAKPILDQVTELAAQGLGVLMVTHRLAEVSEYCSDVTVLRDGEVVHSGPAADATHDELVNAMVGRARDEVRIAHYRPEQRGQASGGAPVLSARSVVADGVQGATFDVRPGEVLGIAGIVGSGASELGRAVAGVTPLVSGTLEFEGAEVGRRWSPRRAIRAGVCFVPQDRHEEGGVLALSLGDNIILPRYRRYWRAKAREREDVDSVVTGLEIHPPLPAKPFAEFSGGNQQKALLGKWLLLRPSVLVLDDPTYGVDPHARETLLRAIGSAADDGTAVIVISTEPEQLARICDRVLVMRNHRISAELTGEHINDVEISLACFS